MNQIFPYIQCNDATSVNRCFYKYYSGYPFLTNSFWLKRPMEIPIALEKNKI
jgi:hypothetical protein